MNESEKSGLQFNHPSWETRFASAMSAHLNISMFVFSLWSPNFIYCGLWIFSPRSSPSSTQICIFTNESYSLWYSSAVLTPPLPLLCGLCARRSASPSTLFIILMVQLYLALVQLLSAYQKCWGIQGERRASREGETVRIRESERAGNGQCPLEGIICTFSINKEDRLITGLTRAGRGSSCQKDRHNYQPSKCIHMGAQRRGGGRTKAGVVAAVGWWRGDLWQMDLANKQRWEPHYGCLWGSRRIRTWHDYDQKDKRHSPDEREVEEREREHDN